MELGAGRMRAILLPATIHRELPVALHVALERPISWGLNTFCVDLLTCLSDNNVEPFASADSQFPTHP